MKAKKTPAKRRDPSWRFRHALGHKVEPDRTKYSRKPKHKQSPRNPTGGFDFGAGHQTEKGPAEMARPFRIDTRNRISASRTRRLGSVPWTPGKECLPVSACG